MVKRSVFSGLLVGILFTLVAVYPMWAIYAGPRVPGLPAAGGVQPLLLIANGAVGVVVLGLVGSLAARRANATDLLSGAKAGAISGLLVALVFYVLLLAPTSALVASARLWAYEPTLRAPYPPDAAILRFFHDMTRASHSRLDLTLLAGAVLGAIEGAIVGWRRRHNSRPVPSLLDVVAEPQARRRWFAGQDEVWRAGMIAGLVGGGVMWLGITVLFFINITVEW
ncbi:MAG: hypothetical protein PVG11_08805, partial [Anaerolineae bacterium]